MAIVIGMMSRKGGAGKSTMTKLLASALVYADRKVLIIDLDPAADIPDWWSRAVAHGNHDPRVSVRATTDSEELYRLVNTFDDKVDFIIIDTKGEGHDWADDLASVADRLIVPCMLSASDYKRTRETLAWHADLISRAENGADDVPPINVVLTRMPPSLLNWTDEKDTSKGVSSISLQHFQEVVKEFKPLKILVPDRQQYLDMDQMGLLGTILNKARAGDTSERGRVPAYASALAHASELLNTILRGETMEVYNGA